ncbi:class I SAM-dependent methyltransferase [Magnetococcales bacterium HHB-1]
MEPTRLNLGCGSDKKEGYLNVDKIGDADLIWDLEKTPWPWQDNVIDEILMYHVLEHLGAETEQFLKIMQEIYRVCKPGAVVHIHVPHPRHDVFINDPTHVRPITPNGLALFSREKNLQWQRIGVANTPLALLYDVDFHVNRSQFVLDEPWQGQLATGNITPEQVHEAEQRMNNVVREIQIELQVIKVQENPDTSSEDSVQETPS